jgi:hypothetical protein
MRLGNLGGQRKGASVPMLPDFACLGTSFGAQIDPIS